MKVVDHAVTFLEPIVRFWTILNINGLYNNVLFRHPLRCPIRAAASTSLRDVTNFAIVFKKMSPFSYHRVKSLTKDTSTSLVHTCHALVDLAKYIISIKNFSFVKLEKFKSDQ